MQLNMEVGRMREELAKHGQEHLLDHWDSLTVEEQGKLRKELEELDFKELNEYFTRTVGELNNAGQKLDDRMEPLDEDQCGAVVKSTDEDLLHYESLSMSEISGGRVGILLLAGGQGTRLGTSYPKGMYNVGLPSGKTLFQLQAERILKLERLAAARTGVEGNITWYIMTSASTMAPTKTFFSKNNYFGLKEENIVVFQQGTLPCFSFEGKILLSEKNKLSRAPDGNGGLYRSLRVQGVLEDMKRRGIKSIQLYCVDNILVKVGDPYFMGYCLSKGAECANKVVRKGFPTEAVGITCKVDGHYQVVEYSEITNTSAELKNKDGSLVYSAANICIHFFTFEFLERVVTKNESSLQHHVAKKKIPFVDAAGEVVVPTSPNGIKMEKFVFDVFRFANNFVVWECLRDEEFAPLKNAEGAKDFTPSYCRNALLSLHQKWLTVAGAEIVSDAGGELALMTSPASEGNNNAEMNQDGGEEVVLTEICPLLSYSGEGLKDLVSGKRLTPPIHLTLSS
jgi:UDP-N-acetylglucosamine/UDP-N-acetylgalactosamine diphosphorylase